MADVGGSFGGGSGSGGGGGATPPVIVKDEGVVVEANLREIDFEGSGVVVTSTSTGKVKVTVNSGGGSDIFENGILIKSAIDHIDFLLNVNGLITVDGNGVKVDLRNTQKEKWIFVTRYIPANTDINISVNTLDWSITGDSFGLGSSSGGFVGNKNLEVLSNGRTRNKTQLTWVSDFVFRMDRALDPGDEILIKIY